MAANENLIIRFELAEVDDSGEQQTVRGQGRDSEMLGGQKFKPPRIQPYGFSANPPKGSQGIAIALNGNLDQAMIIGTEHPQHRPKDQESGESQLYDDQGQYIKIARDKIIIHTSLPVEIQGGASITLKATDIILDGNCYIGGPDANKRATMTGTLDTALAASTDTNAATKVWLK